MNDLTPADRAELRERHVLCTPCTLEHCRLCSDPTWPCPTIRALDALDALEKEIRALRCDGAACPRCHRNEVSVYWECGYAIGCGWRSHGNERPEVQP